MSEHEVPSSNDGDSSEDSVVDAISAVILILVAVSFCIYWVANQ
jgi:hypothetical protein